MLLKVSQRVKGKLFCSVSFLMMKEFVHGKRQKEREMKVSRAKT